MIKFRSFPIICVLLIGISLFCTSCYDESAKINPEYRIIGAWHLSHTYLNGESTDTASYLAFRPGTYFDIYADHILNVMVYHNGQIRESTFSTWQLLNNNDNLALDFSVLGRHYQFTATIKKLTRKELIFEYDDAEQNHWRLEFYSRSSY